MHTQRRARKNSHRHDHHNNKTQRKKKPTHTHTYRNSKHTLNTKKAQKSSNVHMRLKHKIKQFLVRLLCSFVFICKLCCALKSGFWVSGVLFFFFFSFEITAPLSLSLSLSLSLYFTPTNKFIANSLSTAALFCKPGAWETVAILAVRKQARIVFVLSLNLQRPK
jgi:ABC-type nickel/cobalt efflux system permease component RcnA